MSLDTIHKENAIKWLDIIYDSESTEDQVEVARCELISMVAPEFWAEANINMSAWTNPYR